MLWALIRIQLAMADDHDGGAVGQQLVERVSDAEEDVGESWEEIDEEVRQ